MINCICGVKNKRTDNIGNHYEKTAASGATITKSYYYAGGRRVAMRETSASGNQLSFLLSDHLGSTSITAGASGARTAELRYKPWGETRYTYSTTPTSFTFTGQRVESKLGLHFYNARWYDSQLGRFIQADSVVPYPSDPQSWDRFAYVRNNPISRVDPSGHMDEEDARRDGEEPEDETEGPITRDEEFGVCINIWNIGCSGTWESNIEDFNKNLENLPYNMKQWSKDPIWALGLDDQIPYRVGLKDWGEIDKVDLAVDGFGVIGDIAYLTGPLGQVIWAASEVPEFLTIGKAWDELEMGDSSGVLLDTTITILQSAKLLPETGSISNLFGLGTNVLEFESR